MIDQQIRVKCETPGCSQFGFTKNTNRYTGSAGPGLAYKATIVCTGCGAEPRTVKAQDAGE